MLHEIISTKISEAESEHLLGLIIEACCPYDRLLSLLLLCTIVHS